MSEKSHKVSLEYEISSASLLTSHRQHRLNDDRWKYSMYLTGKSLKITICAKMLQEILFDHTKIWSLILNIYFD